MNRFLFILSVFLITACENSVPEKANSETPKTNMLIDSAPVKEEENPVNQSPLTFLEEDSVAFANSTNKEEKLVEKYCKCTKAKGSLNRDCREFLKELNVYEAISDKIRTKYFYNDSVSKKLNKRIKELTDKLNACSN